MRLAKLTEEEIGGHLAKLPGWTRADEALTRTYEFRTFSQAMDFVNQTAEAAESVQHHPDFLIQYSKVTLTLTTHDSGGLTKNDTDMAAACDGYADAILA